MYDFLLVIMFFIDVPISCVHVPLWTYIFMIGVYIETYTHKNSYIFLIFKFFSDHLLLLLIRWWFLKGTSFSFYLIFCLHLNKLVDLSALSLGCVCGKYMICTMCLLYLQTMVMLHSSLY